MTLRFDLAPGDLAQPVKEPTPGSGNAGEVPDRFISGHQRVSPFSHLYGDRE
jgi:hypothetical protein